MLEQVSGYCSPANKTNHTPSAECHGESWILGPVSKILHHACYSRIQFYSNCNLYFRVLPAGDIVEHWVASFGCSCLVKDVKGLQGFELFFLMDLVPMQRSKEKQMFRCFDLRGFVCNTQVLTQVLRDPTWS